MRTETAAIKTGAVRLVQSHGPLLTLVALWFIAALCLPVFRKPDNTANIFRQASMLGLVSIGMAFVILSGGIDLSVGSIAALASIFAMNTSAHSPAAAVLIPILVGIAVGAINGVLVAWVKIPPFIATLAMMLGIRGYASILAKETASADTADRLAGVLQWFSHWETVDVLGIPFFAVVFCLALGAAAFVSKYTSFGRSVYAVGGNEEAARMMGLSVTRCKMFVYMISGGCAGVAGILLAARVNSIEPDIAVGLELTAIAAVVISGMPLTGGTGKISHILYGVLILGTIPNVINHLPGRVESWYSDMITGVLLLAVVLLQSKLVRSDT